MKVKNLASVEAAIARIAEIESSLRGLDAETAGAIAEAKADFLEKSRPLDEELRDLLEKLQEYSDSHRDELYSDGAKSRAFVSGTIGYRKKPDTVEVSSDTADLLIKLGFDHCVKIKKEPVKAAMKNMGADQLESVHARLVPGGENFYCDATERPVPAA